MRCGRCHASPGVRIALARTSIQVSEPRRRATDSITLRRSIMTTPTADRIPTRRSGGLAAKLALILALVLVVALAVFALQNTVHTTVSFIGWDFELAQGVWLLGAAAVGAVIALVVSAALRVRRAIR